MDPTVANRLDRRLAEAVEPFDSIDTLPTTAILDRIGDSRLVLLGEASHGTSEFYRARERLTQALIEEKGFDCVAIEGDWPDAARLDHYVRHAEYPPSEWTAFARFPTWMWRNEEVRAFVDWLHAFNLDRAPDDRIAFHGLDLYSLYSSVQAILDYLNDVDPALAETARERYGCLMPYEDRPGDYARSALNPNFQSCEQPVLTMLSELLAKRRHYAEHDGVRFMDAVQNARLVADAEQYYRTLYYASHNAWNLRDTHMFETLLYVLDHHGPNSKAVVWAHNSHLGDARATDMSRHRELNLGQLCREKFGDDVYSIGFGTHTGTVAAASDWDGPMEVKPIKPSLEHSYERLCHTTGLPSFTLPLRTQRDRKLIEGLHEERLERAIGVIYRPRTERHSHYFYADLPSQFDEYLWFDETRAVTPFATETLAGMPDTYPFGL